MKLSLTNRLRIGFLVLFLLLAVVSVLGVGRLFQIREDFEDETSRLFRLEVQAEEMSSAFVLQQAALAHVDPRKESFVTARDGLRRSAQAATELAGPDEDIRLLLEERIAAERRWIAGVARPRLHGKQIPVGRARSLAREVAADGDLVSNAVRDARATSREEAKDDTRRTAILILAGLGGALLAALLLFTGLVNSMRGPLARLVEGARRLAGGDLEARVEVGGPVEIATLGSAFNDMASELERDRRERDRLERMRDDFLLTVSHELRTPVTVVKGFAEMLGERDGSLDPRQAEAVALIADSAGQLSGMIDDLLDLARSDAGKLRIERRRTAVESLADKAARQMGPNFREKNQRLEVEVEEGVPDVLVDPDRIGQVLANLLINAHKYCPEGANVQLSASRVGDEVEFAVADDGPGIDEEQLDHVFDRFWRSETGEQQTVGGTGLGLAIAKSLIELHDGAIAVTSQPGRGSTFRFVLPAENGRMPRQDTEASSLPDTTESKP